MGLWLISMAAAALGGGVPAVELASGAAAAAVVTIPAAIDPVLARAALRRPVVTIQAPPFALNAAPLGYPSQFMPSQFMVRAQRSANRTVDAGYREEAAATRQPAPTWGLDEGRMTARKAGHRSPLDAMLVFRVSGGRGGAVPSLGVAGGVAGALWKMSAATPR